MAASKERRRSRGVSKICRLFAKLVINFVGPVIGNHSGPGTLALFFQRKHK